MKPTNLKQAITESSWEDWIQDEMLAAASNLGLNMQQWLLSQLEADTFPIAKESVYVVVSSAEQIMVDLKKQDLGYTRELFQSAYQDATYEYGKALLPLVSDISSAAQKKELIYSEELQVLVNALKAKLVRYLPEEDLIEILRSSIIYFLSNSDYVMELKRLYYYQNFAYPLDNWNTSFIDALRNNREYLGSEDITVEGKLQPPTVQNWITDFIATGRSSTAQRSTYDVIQYYNQSENAKKLNSSDRQTLVSVLKLFGWLKNPVVLPQEIETYEFQDSKSDPPNDNNLVIFSDPKAQTPSTIQDVVRIQKKSSEITPQMSRGSSQPSAGLVLDTHTNVQLDDLRKEIQSDQAALQVDIDRKLQSLKQRKDQNQE